MFVAGGLLIPHLDKNQASRIAPFQSRPSKTDPQFLDLRRMRLLTFFSPIMDRNIQCGFTSARERQKYKENPSDSLLPGKPWLVESETHGSHHQAFCSSRNECRPY